MNEAASTPNGGYSHTGISRRALGRLGANALVSAAGVAALAACGPFGQREAPGARQQVVEFMDWGDIQNTPTEVVVNDFRAKFPHLQVDVMPVPPGYEDKMRAMLAAGTPADIHRVNDDYVRGYTEKGQLLDLTPYLKKSKIRREDFYEFIYDFPIHQGKYWAWNVGNNPRLFFVNVTLFKQMGVPPPLFDRWDPPGWTWEDFVETAKRMTVGFDSDRPQFGTSIYDDTGYEQTFLVNFGVDEGIYSKATNPQRWTMGTPQGIEALQQVIDLTCKHKAQRPFNFGGGGSGALFEQGRLAMRFSTSGYANTLNRNVKDNFEWDVAPVPKKVKRMTEGSLITFSIPKEAKNPDGAWELLNHMASDDGGRVFAEARSFVPPRKSAAERYYKPRPGEKPDRLALVVGGNAVQSSVNFAAGTERARNIYRPEFNRRAYTCQESVKVVMDSVGKAIEDALADRY